MSRSGRGAGYILKLEKAKERKKLRDYFAGCALTGIMVYPGQFKSQAELAEYTYQVADAMLKERDKSNESA